MHWHIIQSMWGVKGKGVGNTNFNGFTPSPA